VSETNEAAARTNVTRTIVTLFGAVRIVKGSARYDTGYEGLVVMRSDSRRHQVCVEPTLGMPERE
jgi:hypothetical protein